MVICPRICHYFHRRNPDMGDILYTIGLYADFESYFCW